MIDRSYPKWIYCYLCFVPAVSAVFAAIIYINPEAMWGHWEAAGAAGAFNLVGPAGLFFCARNLDTAAYGYLTAAE